MSWNATTKIFDDALETMALARIAAGDHIIVVDMENALSYPVDLDQSSPYPGIHPTSTGYQKMANVWYNTLSNILANHSLTLNYVGNGNVTKLPDQTTYAYGTEVSLAAQADNGWSFSHWSGDLANSDNPESITMNGSKTVTAIFIQNQYTLIVTVNPSAGGSVSASNPGPYHLNDVVTLTPTANIGYVFSSWGGDGAAGMGNTRVVTVTGNMTVIATFIHQYKLTLTANTGTTTPSVGEYWYAAGSTVTIEASSPTAGADKRYSWLGWVGSGIGSYNGTDNPIFITMNGPITETASWRTEYKLTITTNLGTTTPTVGDNWYDAASSVNVTTSPPSAATGVQYVCSGWSGTGSVPASGSTSTVTFTINAPSNITWTWATQYYLTVSSTYGTVGGSGWYTASSSANATVTPTTVDGSAGVQYIFAGWSGDASGGSSPSNPIAMTSPKTATATWETHNPPTPTPTPCPHLPLLSRLLQHHLHTYSNFIPIPYCDHFSYVYPFFLPRRLQTIPITQ